tara:strand:- start:676 stop:3078 length:2403 start_codon:yes stop_codon:yes gene_type:complete
MSLFNSGYSRQTTLGENLIQGEDPSDKILEEGKKYLQQWKTNSEAEQADQKRYLTALDNSFKLREASKDANEKLASYFRKGWGEALTKRHDQMLKNAEGKRDEATANKETLQKAFGIGGDFAAAKAAKFVKAQNDFGAELVADLGMPHELLEGIRKAEDLSLESNKQNYGAVYEARKRGYTEEQIQSIRDLNWFQRQGVALGHAQYLSENYQSLLIDKHNIEYPSKFGGTTGKVSLASAFSTLDPKKTKHALSLIKREFLQSDAVKGVSKHHLATVIKKGIDAAEAQVMEAVSTKSLQVRKETFEKRERATHAAYIKKGIPEYVNFLASMWGENGENRAAILSTSHNHLLALIKNETIGMATVVELGEHEFTPKGRDTPVKWEDHFRDKYIQLEKAAADALNAQANRNTAQERARVAQLSRDTEDLRELLFKTPPTRDQVAKMIAETNRLHGRDNKMSKMLMTMTRDHVSEANDKVWIPWLDDLEAIGMLTPSAVHNANLTNINRAKYLKKAEENSPYRATDKQIAAMESYVKKKIERDLVNGFGVESKHVPSSAMAIYSGQQAIKQYYRTYAQKAGVGFNPQEVMQAAEAAFNDEYKRNYQIVEFQGGQRAPYFKNFAVGSKIQAVPLSEITTQELADNPKILREKLFVEPVAFKKFLDNASVGIFNGFPADLMHLTSKIGLNKKGRMKTEIDVLLEQADAMKKAGLLEEDWELPPELEQMHRGVMATIPDEWKPYVCGDKCTVESVAATLLYSGYNHEVNTKEGRVSSSQNGFSVVRQPQNMKQYNTDEESLMEAAYG